MLDNNFVHKFRELVSGVNQRIRLSDGRVVTAINLDNAATTPPLQSAIDAINELSPWYSSIHRGSGYKSSFTTEFYDNSRKIVADYVNVSLNKNVVIYVKNTSEAINHLASTLYSNNSRQIILVSEMEHHSNLLPWRDKFETDSIRVDKNGRLSMDDLHQKLRKHKGRVGLVAVTGTSNVTGFVNPVFDIAAVCHEYGARIFVDAAQMIPHCRIDMLPESDYRHIDFIAFSAHKLYAPFGTGVLIGPREDFSKKAPVYSGGGTVKYVTNQKVLWAEPPERNEAGTPNVMGVAALVAALKTMTDMGMDKICHYEAQLLVYALNKLVEIPDIKIYSDCLSVSKQIPKHISKAKSCSIKCESRNILRIENQIGIIAFNINGLHHETVARALAEESGISVRSGCFCAHPYVQQLLKISPKQRHHLLKHPESRKPGMLRISFGFYNTFEEIDSLVGSLKAIIENKNHFAQLYQ